MGSVNGKIKRLVSDKGFGFVAAQDGTEYSSTSRRASAWRLTRCAKGSRLRSTRARAPRVPAPKTSHSPNDHHTNNRPDRV